ncbi:MAG: glycosyltransferase [Desulfobulbaceae bacterium]|nr:glycosyltransferase [Desulfobulbaceae bacterium]
MINILHVSDKLSAANATMHGVSRLLSWWIPRFDPNNFQVKLCSLRQWDAAADYLQKSGIDISCLDRAKFDPMTLFDLIGIIRRQEIDILHLHGYGATTFGRLAGIFTSTPCIVHEHMYDAKIPFYQRWMDAFLSRCDYQAIAVSDSVKNFMVRLRHIPEERVQVIRNGVPFEMFDRSGDRRTQETFRARLNIPSDHKIIAIVGRLDPIKGHTYFLQAAQLVLRQFDKVTFLVVGDGELMSELRRESQELNIASHVIFTGHCDDVPALLSESDIKVISSLSEGIPMTLFEAMAAGCPVVSTDVGGLAEVIKEGKTGFLVPPQQPSPMAEKILLLLRDEDLSGRMSRMAKEASKGYDICHTVHLIEESYKLSMARHHHLATHPS